jgi:hypothetical protein
MSMLAAMLILWGFDRPAPTPAAPRPTSAWPYRPRVA